MDPSWLTDTSCNSVIGPGRWDGSYLVQWKLKEMDRYPGPNAQCMVFFMGVSKNRGFSPKMDGENNGKPY